MMAPVTGAPMSDEMLTVMNTTPMRPPIVVISVVMPEMDGAGMDVTAPEKRLQRRDDNQWAQSMGCETSEDEP